MPKTLRELKEFDTIDLQVDLREMKIPKRSCFESILPEFVLKMKATHPAFASAGECVIYAYLNESTGILEVYLYYRADYSFSHFVTVDFAKFNGTSFDNMFLEFGTNVTVKMAEMTTLIVIDALNYICEQLTEINTIVKRDRKQRSVRTKGVVSLPTNTNSKTTTRVLNADRVIYTVTSSNSSAFDKLRTYQRRAQSWNVVGHTRRYKSGKTVWVNPYVKGEGKKEPKTYIVK